MTVKKSPSGPVVLSWTPVAAMAVVAVVDLTMGGYGSPPERVASPASDPGSPGDRSVGCAGDGTASP